MKLCVLVRETLQEISSSFIHGTVELFVGLNVFCFRVYPILPQTFGYCKSQNVISST